MRLSNLFYALLAALLLISCAPSKQASQSGANGIISSGQLTELTDLIQQLPADNSTEQAWLNEQILDMGSSATHALVGMLKSPGIGNDTYARYAVNGLAKYVSRPGADTERSSFEQVLLTELQATHPGAVKEFLMEQLELVGSDSSVPIIQPFLADEQLYNAAAQVLRSVNTPKAEAALLQALPKTTIPQRAVLIKTLGDMEASSSQLVRQVQTMANSTDENLKSNALYALANSGNPEASETIDTYGSVQHQLRFARRLAEEGHPQESAEVARKIYNSEQPAHHRIAALTLFHQSQGAGSPDLLMAAATDSNAELRSAALNLIRDIEGTQITSELTNLLDQANPDVRADIIESLGRRGDKQAWDAVQNYIRDDSREVRLAAIGASTPLGGTDAIGSLLRALDNAEANEISVVKKALLQQPSQALFSAAEQGWMNLSTQAKVALIEVLAQRRGRQYMNQLLSELYNFNGQVRLATFQALSVLGTQDDLSRFVSLLSSARNEEETNAIQQAIASVASANPDEQSRTGPIVNALEQASTEQVSALLETLGMIGGEQAVESVAPYTSHSNTGVRNSAISVLANWPDARAIQPILETLETTEAENSRRLLDGFARIVRGSHYSHADKVQFLAEAADAVSTEEADLLVLGALSGIHSEASLRTVISFVENSSQEVQNRAYRAAAEILAPSYRFSEDFDGADQTLSVLEAATDSTTRQKVVGYIQEFQSQQELSEGFNALFNGTDLAGWTGDKEAYEVQDGQLIHKAGQNGHLFSQQEYGDFILRFQFKLTPGANNGLAIRAPLEGNPAYQGMELQILDNSAEKWSDLEPYQYHGSIYGVAPAERGHLKPAGEWNTQQVTANGSQITVTLNGVTIVDVDLSEFDNSDTPDGEDHPGLSRDTGHIGFMGHGDEVAFRNIQIRDLNVYYPDYSMGSEQQGGMNQPPEGFKALFNGENLDGWKGLVANPEERVEMSDQELAAAREKADRVMQQHWSVRDGILYFDGNGESLATAEGYKDFEMLLDWKIEPGGDSGVYLRGTPQVQIWDITQNPVGSGGLYNNQQHPSEPLVAADRPIGEWNRMRIKMVGEQVTVHLNNQLVVDDVPLENYWNRDNSIYPKGQIELQSHSTPLYFKNVFIREIPRTESLFNAEDLTGWEAVDGEPGSWQVSDGLLTAEAQGSGWLSSATMYDNFKLELEYRLHEGGNSGIFLRAPHEGNPAYQGMEIQLLDDYAEGYADLEPSQYTGSIYGVKEPSSRATKPAGEWQKMVILADGPHIKITLNGEIINSISLVNHMEKVNEHPGLKRRRGYIGLQNHGSVVEFKNVQITEIE